MGVTEELRLERLLSVPRAPDGGPELGVLEDPQTSLLDAEAPAPLWRAPRLRVSPGGEVALLAPDGSAVARFGAGGEPRSVVPLPRGGRIADHLVTAEGGVLMLEQEERGNVLRRVDPEGHEEWRRSGPAGVRALDWDALEGSFGALLADGAGNAYLAAERPEIAVARIGEDGALTPVAELGPPGASVVMDEAGRLFTVGYDPESRRRSWTALDPASGERVVSWCDAGASAALAQPIGVDRSGRGYGAEVMSVACVATDGSLAWRFTAEDAVLHDLVDPAPGWSIAPAREWRVDADGRVYLAAAGPENVAVLRLSSRS
jgi:hypothetical protein